MRHFFPWPLGGGAISGRFFSKIFGIYCRLTSIYFLADAIFFMEQAPKYTSRKMFHGDIWDIKNVVPSLPDHFELIFRVL